MLVDNKKYQAIWIDDSDLSVIKVIDQQKLPFFFEIKELRSVDDVYEAISEMTVRGAPLIGAAAAFGIYLATLELTGTTGIYGHLSNAGRYLAGSRPTAVNLSWAVNRVLSSTDFSSAETARTSSLAAALAICEYEKENCRQIGLHGLKIIEETSKIKNGEPVNILTHCNAGWLACVDYGTVTAPIYLANERGIPVHVWVDETRPRNQGSKLTAWELGHNNVPYTIITDNAGGHIMQHGMADLVFAGCDRATASGDVANKIGTYLKALAANDNNIPFYAVLPSSSIDTGIHNGIAEIEIEERNAGEVTHVTGFLNGKIESVRICPEGAKVSNYGFDVTPARLITSLITEKGICKADSKSIKTLLSS